MLPEDAPKNAKPRTGSLLKSMELDTVTLDDALRLLTLPRVVGRPGDGEEITAQNGRYGPYVKKGTDSRSLETEDQLFTSPWSEALELYAQPKRAAGRRPRRRCASSARTRLSGKPMVIKDGRFGPYVTDGETNASLRKGDEVETITLERAAELLADRRAAGPAKGRGARPPPRRPRRRRPPRRRPPRARPVEDGSHDGPKTAAKKSTAKKSTAKKTAAKKTAAKKAPATKVVAETSG